MEAQVVVWNMDARNRPELEVEISLVADAEDGVPEVLSMEDLSDALMDPWFADDVPLADALVIHDAVPHGYRQAFRASA